VFIFLPPFVLIYLSSMNNNAEELQLMDMVVIRAEEDESGGESGGNDAKDFFEKCNNSMKALVVLCRGLKWIMVNLCWTQRESHGST
jgi:hypothetical protein